MRTRDAGASPLRADAVVARGFLTLGAGEALGRLIAFTATAFVARRLGADVYGMIVLAMTVILYVNKLSDCGITLLGVRDVAHDRTQLPALLPEYLGIRLLLSTGLIVVLVFVGLVLYPQPEGAILAVFAFTLAPISLRTRWAHLGLERPAIVSISRIANELLAAALIIALVRSPGDAAVVPLAQIAGEGVGAYLLLRALPRVTITLRDLVRGGRAVTLYRRSWPLVLNALLGLVIFNSDYFFLRVYHGSATVGYYAAAYALIAFLVVLGQWYGFSLLPAITRLRSDPEGERRLYHSALAQLFALSFPLALGGTLVASRLIPFFYGDAFRSSALPLQILIWSVPIANIRQVAQCVLLSQERQKAIMVTAAWAAGCNLALNALVIPRFGMAGAAVVTVATETVRTVPMLSILRRSGLPMASVRRFWRPLVAGGLMSAAVLAAGLQNLWASVAIGCLGYVLALVLVGGIRLRTHAVPELVL